LIPDHVRKICKELQKLTKVSTKQIMNNKPKIIVLDDDPTGSQTVHSCLLLMRWDVETLRLGLKDDAPILFILTNTRSLTPDAAASVTREVCHHLKLALASEKMSQDR